MHPPTQLPLILLLGPLRTTYPEPLQSLLPHFEIHPLPTLHEIAAALSTEKNIHALLLDPAILTRKTLQSLPLLTRRFPIPILLLPLTPAASPAARSAHLHQILPWEKAAEVLQPSIHNSQFRILNSQALSHPSQTDNPPSPTATSLAEISLTIHPAKRYDELGNTPLVSPQEMAALLGVIE